MRVASWAIVVAVSALAGCGGSDGSTDPPVVGGPTVTQHITRDFGREVLSLEDDLPLERGATVMDLLRATHDVEPTPTDEDVLGIDGLVLHGGADETSWVLYVNGSEAFGTPAERVLHSGDVIQWDYRPWDIDSDVDAIVGAFPQPLAHGFNGVRLAVTVRCVPTASIPCRRVKRALGRAGVRLGTAAAFDAERGRFVTPGRMRVLVGTWRRLRATRPLPIDQGLAASGVFARFSPDSRALGLLDWKGRLAESHRAGAGLVAATQRSRDELLWVVTGTNDRGVARAAAALDADGLRNAFAMAVTQAGVTRLPLVPR
jgi:hypothetical protein